MVNNATYSAALVRSISQLPMTGGRILVTGASGMIGSCLIDMLMLANKYGYSFDVYALGRNRSKLLKRFKAFEESSLLHIIEQDIRFPLDDSIDVDYIIHGASPADPIMYANNPTETMLTIFEGTTNMLNYCVRHKKTRMLLLSSFEVYGNNGNHEYSEDDFGAIDMNQIRSCYPESKRNAEILAKSYSHEFGVNALIARLCSIYGPTMAMDDSKAHAQFLRNAVNKENIILKSKGQQYRGYCHVIDAVTAMLTILAKGKCGEAYNVSYEGGVSTIADIARCVSEIAGTGVVYEQLSTAEEHLYSKPINCVLKNEKLRSLGWKGHYGIKEGLAETLSILIEMNRDNK
ncbi:MAG: NAD-dependent epimerase/dehydratase family protein [Prevotella sp.]|nr:NAD-dependent epimerase/dehydratase family protein [Prevotella sp.]